VCVFNVCTIGTMNILSVLYVVRKVVVLLKSWVGICVCVGFLSCIMWADGGMDDVCLCVYME